MTAFFALSGPPQPARGEPSEGKGTCLASRQDNRPYTRKLGNGYQLSVGPSGTAREEGDRCSGTIIDPAGKVVFRTDGFNIVLDEDVTGQDVDGDGKSDVVFRTDTGGGQHCCWSYNVVSLHPRPRKLFDIDASGKVKFEKDKHGRMVIWQRVPGPDGYTDMADRPFAERVFRVNKGKLVDSTPEFCSRIQAPGDADFDQQNRILTPERLKTLPAGSSAPQQIASALLSRALQSTFCRRFDEALRDLELWPREDQRRVKMDFGQSVKDEYPAFAARLSRG